MNGSGPRLAMTTSTYAGGSSGAGSDALASPGLPGSDGSRSRRRSTLVEDTEAWKSQQQQQQQAVQANGSAMRAEPNRMPLEREQDDDYDDDYNSEAAGLLTDDEETGLTGAERRKRRLRKDEGSQLDQRVAPGAANGPAALKLVGVGDASVTRRSMINVGLILLWYLFSLSISIYNKWMFGEEHLNFKFPLFTTSMHMVVQFSLASTVLYFVPRFRPNVAAAAAAAAAAEPGSGAALAPVGGIFSVVSKWFYLTRLGPCGAATGLDIGLGNMSLEFITLTFFTMCKSSALAFVLLFAFVFRLEAPSVKLVLIIAAMTGGVVMMVSGEINFDWRGFVLIMLSSFFSGFRWALTQILLLRHPATSNPFASIFFLTPLMFVCLFALAIPIEGFGPLGDGLARLMDSEGDALGPLLLLFPGILAFCMTSAEYALLQRTSVVTLSICGIFKEVVTITAAEITYHDPLTPINLSGLSVTVLSIAAYNYIKIQKMRSDAKNAAADAAPSTRGDIDEGQGMLDPDAIELLESDPLGDHRADR